MDTILKSESTEYNKKITKSWDLTDYEILTDKGWSDVVKLHETIEYDVYELRTNDFTLKCADNHIIFDSNNNEIFAKDVKVGDIILTENGEQEVVSLLKTDEKDVMYDFELTEQVRCATG